MDMLTDTVSISVGNVMAPGATRLGVLISNSDKALLSAMRAMRVADPPSWNAERCALCSSQGASGIISFETKDQEQVFAQQDKRARGSRAPRAHGTDGGDGWWVQDDNREHLAQSVLSPLDVAGSSEIYMVGSTMIPLTRSFT